MKLFLLGLLLCFALQTNAHSAVEWETERGNFAFCLLNAPSGFYVGTESNGLWRRDARGQWNNITRAQGLGGDSVRCLLGRGEQIWAGHARAGLSVWDGTRWQQISVTQGLPSERVSDFALTETGDVWVATDGGLCRWSDDAGWTMPDSPLARRQMVALAWARGNLWAATACDGLLVSRDDGASWTSIAGAPVQPVQATGDGLPSNVLNDVAVDELGQIWVATDLGIARSDDEGATWVYVRGADWEANVRGSALDLQPRGEDAPIEPPGEDWVQTLASDGDGHIWLGMRQKGVEVRDIVSGDLLSGTRFLPGQTAVAGAEWVRAIYPLPQGRAITARYGDGVGSFLDADFPAPLAPTDAPKFKVPGEFAPLSAEQIANLKLTAGEAGASVWNLDYRTRGDWVGRYGDALAWVYERPWQREFRRDPNVQFEVQAGYHVSEGDNVFGHIAELKSADLRILYNPALGTRRIAEVNDGSWQTGKYPFSWEGPDLWVSVEVPAGAHRAALYFVNANGHGGSDRYRDFIVQLKAFTPDIEDADAAPDLARCRVRDFWDGAYASFALAEPGKYWIKIARHRSFVTKIAGIFVDRIDGKAATGFRLTSPLMRGVNYRTQPTPAIATAENPTIAAARAAWQRLDLAAAENKPHPDDWQLRHQLLRAIVAAGASEELQANWRWKLAIWTDADRAQFASTMAQIETKRVADQADQQAAAPPE